MFSQFPDGSNWNLWLGQLETVRNKEVLKLKIGLPICNGYYLEIRAQETLISSLVHLVIFCDFICICPSLESAIYLLRFSSWMYCSYGYGTQCSILKTCTSDNNDNGARTVQLICTAIIFSGGCTSLCPQFPASRL